MLSSSIATSLFIIRESCNYVVRMDVLRIIDDLLGNSVVPLEDGQVELICKASKQVDVKQFLLVAALLAVSQVRTCVFLCLCVCENMVSELR